jgi:hypothetical protein
MKHLRKFNESKERDSILYDLKDIVLELDDIGFYTLCKKSDKVRGVLPWEGNKFTEYEVYISLPGNQNTGEVRRNARLINWSEIKEAVIRINDFYDLYIRDENTDIKFYSDGIEFMNANKEKDFNQIGDSITCFRFRICITINKSS